MSSYAPGTTPGNTDPFLTAAEVAQFLKVDKSTVRRWIARGKLPAYRAGDKAVRVRLSDVERLIAPLHSRHQTESKAVTESLNVRPLTVEQQQQGLRALADLQRLHDELHAKKGPLELESSGELLAALRDERTQELVRNE